MTLAFVSSRRNRRSRAQTSIVRIENQHFLVQMAPQASWPPGVPAESLEARNPQPGIFSQESSRVPLRVPKGFPSLEGSLKGSFRGSLEGSFEGSLEGSLKGSLEVSLEGSLEGSFGGSREGP